MSYIEELKKECIISDLSAVELACAEVDSLRLQLTEARADSERLDWIEKNDPFFMRHFPDGRDGGRIEYSVSLHPSDLQPFHANLRGAIDQARASQHSGEGK